MNAGIRNSSSEKQITYVFRLDLNQVKCVLRYFVSSLLISTGN